MINLFHRNVELLLGNDYLQMTAYFHSFSIRRPDVPVRSAQDSFVPDLGSYYGGGFITDDSMYMVIDTESSSGKLIKFPITRDSKRDGVYIVHASVIIPIMTCPLST